MCEIYVTEHGSVVGHEDGRLYISNKHQKLCSMPLNHIDKISIQSNSMLTGSLVKHCLRNSIDITYLTEDGRYLGRLQSDSNPHVHLQRKQCALYHSEFAFNYAKACVESKIRNQIMVLHRHTANDSNLKTVCQNMKRLQEKIFSASTLSSLRSIEGNVSRIYFKAINTIIPDDFRFASRSRQPPKDLFNALLGFGYTYLYNRIYTLVLNKGLNPFFGFYHQDSEGHASLVSDIMEEWRAPVVDACLIKLVNKSMLHADDFRKTANGVYLSKHGISTVTDALISRLQKKVRYSPEYNMQTSYQNLMTLCIDRLADRIMSEGIPAESA